MKTRFLRPIKDGDMRRIMTAKYALRLARECLKNADADQAAAYVRRALKSIEGAERHAKRLQEQQRPPRVNGTALSDPGKERNYQCQPLK